MNRALLILAALVLPGCQTFEPIAPYCVVSYGDPAPVTGARTVVCQCMSGAEIPAECGGGVAP